MDVEMDASNQTQYLTFQLAGEEYAISILCVREIIEFETTTKVPGAPRYVRGVINLRGSVVPVIDLAVKLGLPETVLTSRTCVVIVEVDLDGDRVLMGIVTESVSQVLDLQPQEIDPPPAFGMQVRIDYLIGIAKFDMKIVLILDIQRVLSFDELASAVAAGGQLESSSQ